MNQNTTYQNSYLKILLGLLMILPFFQPMQVGAQQDAHYSQYMFNGLVLNPAYAGSREVVTLNMFARQQWIGIDGAPSTQSFSAHMPLPGLNSGFGITASNDRIGYTSQQWVTTSFAYRMKVGKGKLAFGLQGGLLNYGINWDQAVTVDQNDAVIQGGRENILVPNVGTGVYFQSDRFYAGLSAPHILPSPLNTTSTNNIEAQLFQHYFFTTGALLGNEFSNFKFKPSILVKYVSGAPVEVDVNAALIIKNRWWIGLSYRSFDSMVGMFQFQITP
ncbi:MAG: type IX secretion system membrane protein PorP/SprF, partial [Bacteroidota bacterium]